MDKLQAAKQTVLEAGYDLVSQAQKEARKNFARQEAYNTAKVLGREKRYILMKKDNYNTVKLQLTLSQHGILMYLLTCMEINKEGKLFKNKTDRLTMSDVSNLTGKSAAQIRKVVTELENLGIVTRETEGRNSYLSVSEGFFVCGSTGNGKYNTVKIYKQRLKEVVKEISLNSLGFFALMLGNFHWKTNLLVENPEEQETEKLILWKRKDLEEAYGLSRPTVKKCITELAKARMTFVVITIEEAICLDHKITNRQKKEVTVEELLDNIQKASLSSDNFKK